MKEGLQPRMTTVQRESQLKTRMKDGHYAQEEILIKDSTEDADLKKKRETSKQERPLEIRFESIEVPSAEEGRKKATSFNSAASHGYGQPA